VAEPIGAQIHDVIVCERDVGEAPLTKRPSGFGGRGARRRRGVLAVLAANRMESLVLRDSGR
jgi:hypothetical protein